MTEPRVIDSEPTVLEPPSHSGAEYRGDHEEGGIGRAARSGAIIKDGLHLEILSGVDTVVLDKTGTLTFGDPAVTGVRPVAGATGEEVLAAAAIAERPSEHPLAKAILKKARETSLPVIEPDTFSYLPVTSELAFILNSARLLPAVPKAAAE